MAGVFAPFREEDDPQFALPPPPVLPKRTDAQGAPSPAARPPQPTVDDSAQDYSDYELPPPPRLPKAQAQPQKQGMFSRMFGGKPDEPQAQATAPGAPPATSPASREPDFIPAPPPTRADDDRTAEAIGYDQRVPQRLVEPQEFVPMDEGAFRSGLRSFSTGIIPNTAAAVGSVKGTALGAFTTPVTGPVGPIAGSISGAAIGHMGGSKAQRELVRAIQGDEGLWNLDKQLAYNAEQHPIASGVGSMLAALPLLLAPSKIKEYVGKRGANAVMKVGMTAAEKQAAYQGLQTAANARLPRVLANATRWAGLESAPEFTRRWVYEDPDAEPFAAIPRGAFKGMVVGEVATLVGKGIEAGASRLNLAWAAQVPPHVAPYLKPAAQYLGGIFIEAPSMALTISTAEALYDMAVKGKPFDQHEVLKDTWMALPSYMAMQMVLGAKLLKVKSGLPVAPGELKEAKQQYQKHNPAWKEYIRNYAKANGGRMPPEAQVIMSGYLTPEQAGTTAQNVAEVAKKYGMPYTPPTWAEPQRGPAAGQPKTQGQPPAAKPPASQPAPTAQPSPAPVQTAPTVSQVAYAALRDGAGSQADDALKAAIEDPEGLIAAIQAEMDARIAQEASGDQDAPTPAPIVPDAPTGLETPMDGGLPTVPTPEPPLSAPAVPLAVPDQTQPVPAREAVSGPEGGASRPDAMPPISVGAGPSAHPVKPAGGSTVQAAGQPTGQPAAQPPPISAPQAPAGNRPPSATAPMPASPAAPAGQAVRQPPETPTADRGAAPISKERAEADRIMANDPEKYRFQDDITPSEINGIWGEAQTIQDERKEANAPERSQIQKELASLKGKRKGPDAQRKKDIQDRLEELDALEAEPMARAEAAYAVAQEELAQRIIAKAKAAGIDVSKIDEDAMYDEISNLSDGRMNESGWNKPLVDQGVELIREMAGEQQPEAKPAAKPPELMTPEDRVRNKQELSYGDVWNVMPPAIRGVVTTHLHDGLRSDALKKWDEIPQDRRERYKKFIPDQHDPNGYSYVPPGYTREGDLYVFKGEAQGEKPAQAAAKPPDDFSDFKPNSLGYQSREIEGLDGRYFVAQQSKDQFDIIESSRGSTRAIVSRGKDGWHIRVEGTTQKVGNSFQSLFDTRQAYPTPREAILAFNDALAVWENPEVSTPDQYAKANPGDGKLVSEKNHRTAISNAIRIEKPVSAAAVDAYGIKLPDGYARDGDRYVFKGGQKPAEMRPSNFRLTDNYFTDPRLRTNKRWAWRAMGAKEYAKLMSGEKVYGAGAGKGQFFSPTPDGARQYGEAQNKYLVEFDGVEATGEGISGTASKSNVVRAWRYTNGEWKPIRIDAAKPEMVPTSARADDAPVSPSPAEPAPPVARMTKNDLLAELRAAGVADRDLRGKDRAALAKYAESVRAGGEVAPVQASAAKESWQMTRAEYARGAKVRRDMKRNYVIITGPDGKEVITRTLEPGQPEKGLIEGAHRVEISEALAAGKPVPAEVLADYPDLKPKVAEKPKAPPSGLSVPSVESSKEKYADWGIKEQIMALAPQGSRSAGRLSNALKAAGVPHQFGPPRTLGSKRSSVKIPNTQEAINIVRRMGGTIVKDQPHWLTEGKEPYEQKPTLDYMGKKRREWIDSVRKKNPLFAPDFDSWKELLSPEDLLEVQEYEDLRYRSVAKQGPETGYASYKLTEKEKARLAVLEKKIQSAYSSRSTEETPAPVSSPTPDGKTIEVPMSPKQEAKVTPKEQKKYFIAEIDKAIAEAPEDAPEEGYYPKKPEAADIENNVKVYDRNKVKFGTVTIEVPGDGTFTVLNSKVSLQNLKDRVSAMFPAKAPTATAPSMPSTKPSAIAKVEKRPGASVKPKWDKLMDPFASRDKKSPLLVKPNYNGANGEVVATDSRRLVVALGVKTGAKPVEGYPNYAQIVPGYRRGKLPEIQSNQREATVADTEKIIRQIRQAGLATQDKRADAYIGLYRMPDETVAVTSVDAQGKHGDGYVSQPVDSGELIGVFNAGFLDEAFTFMRKTGNESVTLRWLDDTSPFIFLGQKEYVLQMPIRGGGIEGMESLREIAPAYGGMAAPKEAKTKKAAKVKEAWKPSEYRVVQDRFGAFDIQAKEQNGKWTHQIGVSAGEGKLDYVREWLSSRGIDPDAVEGAKKATSSAENKLDTLKLGAGNDIPPLEVDQIAAPVLTALGNIPDAGSGVDGAGIAKRGGSVYSEALDGKFTLKQLGAAYRWLRENNANRALIDSMETAKGWTVEVVIDPIVGKEWNSPYGRQRVKSVEPKASPEHIQYADVETVGTGAIRRYKLAEIDEVAKRNELETTPEYKAKRESEKQKIESDRAADEAKAKAESETAAKIAEYVGTLGLPKLQADRMAHLLKQVAGYDVGGTSTYRGQRAVVVGQLLDAGYKPETKQVNAIQPMTRTQFNRASAAKQAAHDKRMAMGEKKTEYRFVSPSGSYFATTKAEHDYAVWLDGQRAQAQPAAQPEPAAPVEALRAEAKAAGVSPVGTKKDLQERVAAVKAEPGIYSAEAHKEFYGRLMDGNATADEIRANYKRFNDNKDAILAELSKLTKAELLKRLRRMGAYQYKNDTKGRVVKAVLSSMEDDFILTDGFTYQPFQDGGKEGAISRLVENYTDGDIAKFKERVATARAEQKTRMQGYAKALTNPETLDEFDVFLRVNTEKDLKPEQLAKYDELRAQAGREVRKRVDENKAVVGQVRGAAETPMEIVERPHTKRGHNVFIVTMGDRVDGDTFKELAQKARRFGGNWSRAWKPTDSPAGFVFDKRTQAEAFMALRQGSVSRAEDAQAQAQESKGGAVEKLREMADRMEETANEEMNRERQVNTSKRAREAGYADDKARETIRMARTMRNLADAIADGRATHLDGLRNRTQIEALDELLRQAKADRSNETGENYEAYKNRPANLDDAAAARYPVPRIRRDNIPSLTRELREKGAPGAAIRLNAIYGKTTGDGMVDIPEALAKTIIAKHTHGAGWYLEASFDNMNRLRRMGIDDLPTLRAALREYIQYREAKPQADKAKELERKLAGTKIPGFFPTPKAVRDEIMDRADIQPGMKVLEPSAGKGDLADAAKEAGGQVDVLEISTTLQDLLKAKGYELAGTDFTEFDGEGYDRIVMNPPFEDGQDIEHVRRAFGMLKPGGKMVAIMSEGPFFRSDKKATEFRDWLESVGGESEKLPDGSFTDATQVRTTGTATRIVTIEQAFDDLFGTIKTRETDKGVAMYAANGLAPGPQQSIGDSYAKEPTAGMAGREDGGQLSAGAAADDAGRNAARLRDRDGRQGELPGQESGGVQAPVGPRGAVASDEETASEIARRRTGGYAANFAEAEPAPEYADTPEAQDAAAMLKAHGVERVHVVRGMKSLAVRMPDGSVFLDESLGTGAAGTSLHELVHKWKREANPEVVRLVNAFQRSTAAAKRFVARLADSVESALGNRADAEAYADEHAAEEAGAIMLDLATEGGGRSALGLARADVLAAYGGLSAQAEKLARGLADKAQAAKRAYLAGREAQAAPTADATDRAYLDAVERGDTATAQRMVDEAAKRGIDKAVLAAKREMETQSMANESIPVEWIFEDRLEENQKLWFPQPDLPEHLAHLDEFAPKDAIEEIDGKYVLGEELTPHDSLDAAKSAYEAKLKEWASEVDTDTTFGQSASGQDVSAKIFDAFPQHPAIVKEWQKTKWGSWYLDFRDENGAIRKISVRDHDSSRKDMGIPDKSFHVDKSWAPEDVGRALISAWKYIQEESADPVTRDDTGRIIPPSERFNQQSEDIRYAVAPPAPGTKAAERIRKQLDAGQYKAAQIASYAKKGGGDAWRITDENGRVLQSGFATENEARERMIYTMARLEDAAADLAGQDRDGVDAVLDARKAVIETLNEDFASKADFTVKATESLLKFASAITRQRGFPRKDVNALSIVRKHVPAVVKAYLKGKGEARYAKATEAIDAAMYEAATAVREKKQHADAVASFTKMVRRINKFGIDQFAPENKDAIEGLVGDIAMKAMKDDAALRDAIDELRSDPEITAEESAELGNLLPKRPKDMTIDELRYITANLELVLEDQKEKKAVAHKALRDEAHMPRNEFIEHAKRTKGVDFKEVQKELSAFDRPGQAEAAWATRAGTVAYFMDGKDDGPLYRLTQGNFLDAYRRGLEIKKISELKRIEMMGEEFDFRTLMDTKDTPTSLRARPRRYVLDSGETLIVSPDRMVAIHEMTLNPDNMRHATDAKRGGIVYKDSQSMTPIVMSESDMHRIAADVAADPVLSKAAAYIHFVNNEIHNKEGLNPISMRMDAHEIANEPNYFPIKTAAPHRKKQDIQSDEPSPASIGNTRPRSVESAGPLHKRLPSARGPIVLMGAFESLQESEQVVARYQYAPALRILKLAKEPAYDADGNYIGNLEGAVKTGWSKLYWKNVMDLADRIENPPPNETADNWVNWAHNRATVGQLTGNIAVYTYQPVSYVGALPYFKVQDWVAGGMKPAASWEKMGRYSPELYFRGRGKGSDLALAAVYKGRPHSEYAAAIKQINDMREAGEITLGDSLMLKASMVNEATWNLAQRGMTPITEMDRQAIGRIFNSAEIEAKRLNPSITDEEALMAAGRKTDHIIFMSQPASAGEHRSMLQRLPGFGWRFMMRFSSQRTAYHTMLLRANYDRITGKINNTEYLKHMFSLLASQIAIAAVKTLVGRLLYRYEKGDEWKYFSAQVVASMMSLGGIGGDMIYQFYNAIFKRFGQPMSNPIVDGIVQTASGMARLPKAIADGDKKRIASSSRQLARGLGSTLLPGIHSFMEPAFSAYQHTLDETSDNPGPSRAPWDQPAYKLPWER